MATQKYQEQISKYQTELIKLRTYSSRVGWARLLCIVLAISLIIWQWPVFQWLPTCFIFVSVVIFLRLVAIAVDTSARIRHLVLLIEINEEELQIKAGNYYERFDGKEFAPKLHEYALDLDLLGRASLYQFTQRVESEPGRRIWSEWLLQRADNREIEARQEAAKSLAEVLEWRQLFQATGKAKPFTAATEQHLNTWQSFSFQTFTRSFWSILRWVGPLLSVSFLLAYIFDFISFSAFNIYLLVFFIATGYISKLATPAYHQLGKIAEEINTLSRYLACIEEMPANTSQWLEKRLKTLITPGEEPASKQVLKLKGILKRMDYRLNPVAFIPLNILFFWDLQQMIQLSSWQKAHSHKLTTWMKTLGEMEAIATISTLVYNHPDWCFPAMQSTHGFFEAKALGHPLIPEAKRVSSDFETRGIPMVNIITGSNMAGKSTFLRSIGLAMVMGQAGAPVCAKNAVMSNMQVMSSMRIADNLEESTSTFYAELKNLKRMIDAVNAGAPVFLLMDEILRGTNSLDRQKGSKALILQLIRKQAAGMIATHDLELAEMEKEQNASIRNYHFDVQVAGEELYFDYALKTGVCQSLNASILMKKIGIEMNG